MSCLAWNCQGLGGSWTVRTLGDLIRDHNPQLIFLSETRLAARKIELIKRKFGYFGLAVDARGLSGGLALLWMKDIDVVVQSFSFNHIDALVFIDNNNNTSWRFTGFYGEPVETNRHKSWKLLRHLASLSNKPWICAGDFNAMLSGHEKSGGNPVSFSNITDFSNCLRDAKLCDLGFTGYPFTWTNRWTHPYTIRERLDRACANEAWIDMFPHHRVVHLEALNSDHQPILIELSKKKEFRRGRRNRGFKFEAMWLKSEDCARVIKENWQPTNSGGVDTWDNLDSCRIGLMTWSEDSCSKVKKKVAKLKNEVLKLKQGLLTEETKNIIKEKSNELEGLLDKEEMMWRQRAKAHWMREGDKNTKFFHAKASSRRRVNTIHGLRNSEGIWCEKDEDLERIVAEYFEKIFTSSSPSLSTLEAVLGAVEPKVTREINADLLRTFSALEVKKALDSMHPLKSPGPDGFPVVFYQRFWSIVGSDVTKWVLRLLNEKIFPSICNFTYIVLIPKCSDPQTMAQFRPISLSNVIYKIASKVIVNRLKPHMNTIISESQSAFVPGRLISDNILISYEVAHYIKRSKAEHMAIKLDMSKAYDRIEWEFLRQVMVRLGLDSNFVDLIMLCVTTVTYSFVLNGGSFGFLTPKRGIRQGDPLSPYLFLFCAEVLSALIRREELKGNIAGLAVCNGAPEVSHLLFADDTMIFCNANVHSASSVSKVLKEYEEASGQQINFQKSSIVFSRTTTTATIDAIRAHLPMEVVDKHEKYLGLPSVIGKSKKEAFANIRDKVCNRLKGWKEQWLSKGGKEILIKSVIQAIPTYAMSCFKLPNYFTSEIEGLMAKFWWEGTNGKGIHWIRWRDLCQSKQYGGLGFRDLEAFNMALLAKQLWRLLINPHSMIARVFKARYFPNSDVLGSKLGSNPSYTWRSLWGAKGLLEAGTRWRIGNGILVNVWGDKWLPRESTFQLITPRNDRPPDFKVSELIDASTGNWDSYRVRSMFFEDDINCILSIPLGSNQNVDKRIWHYNQNGLFSVKSAYHLAVKMDRDQHSLASSSSSVGVSNDWNWLWNLKLPNKIKIFVWRACKGLLPTRANLVKRKVTTVQSCVMCEDSTEVIFHCLYSCPLARQVWAVSNIPCSVYNFVGFEVRDWLLNMKQKSEEGIFDLCLLLCWSLWHARNKRFFEGTNPNAMEITSFARKYLEDLRKAEAEVLTIRPANNRNETRWILPSEDIIKINFDAAINRVDGCCGIGAIARSSQGECVGWRSKCIKQPLDPTVAESKAALLAVELALEQNWRKIILEGDSQIIISALESATRSYANFGIIIDDIKSKVNSFELFEVRHIWREGNKAAHEVAKLSNIDTFDLNCLPDVILTIVTAESINE
ncbi:hypothetical protein ACJIZ3_022072 [Penstemon smallii]|uniref:Reverse transcriptase domain-containing protein n=1 Tax=Penstemon smallii TaxID=265156 RepID=A0ABD3SNH6_9LAMI